MDRITSFPWDFVLIGKILGTLSHWKHLLTERNPPPLQNVKSTLHQHDVTTLIGVKSTYYSIFAWYYSKIWKLLFKFPLRMMWFFSFGNIGNVEYFDLLLVKSNKPQSYSNGYKRSILTLMYYEIYNFSVPTMVSQLWNCLQVISDD